MGIDPKPCKPGSATLPAPGYDIRILDDNGNELGPNQQGNVAIKLPLPPSCLPSIWGNHSRFLAGYLEQFPGYYTSGDGGYKDADGYVFIMGRTDDVINVAGHRLSTGEMEEVLAGHPAVAECAVIGIADDLKGQVPLGLVLLKDGTDVNAATLNQELVARIRQEIGAVACLKDTLITQRLPKTRSGKILRKLLRQIANGEQYNIPSTIDDPASIPEIEGLLKERALING